MDLEQIIFLVITLWGGLFIDKEHSISQAYYSSDYDLSAFKSHGVGVGMKWKPLDGVFGVKYWERLELRYLHYERNTDLNSDIVSLLINFK